MKILLLCLNAFETMEFSSFVDVMGWAHDDFNCDIVVDICGFNRTIVSTFGVSITADILIDDVDVDQYDALAIPGGFEEYGFYKEAYHEKTLNLIRSFHSQHKPIASVCVAAFPLAKSGILKNRKAQWDINNFKFIGEKVMSLLRIDNNSISICRQGESCEYFRFLHIIMGNI